MPRSYDDSIWTLLSDDEDDEPYPNEEPFRYGERYLYDYQWYHEKFPEAWAVCHEEGTGPGQCNNCADYGSVNEIFIGYCANCAMYIYEGARGRGFIDVGVENSETSVLDYPSAFDTYLKDVDIGAIEPIESDIQAPSDDIVDNDINGDYPEDGDCPEDGDYPEDNTDTSVLNCHFEGGYNDF